MIKSVGLERERFKKNRYQCLGRGLLNDWRYPLNDWRYPLKPPGFWFGSSVVWGEVTPPKEVRFVVNGWAYACVL